MNNSYIEQKSYSFHTKGSYTELNITDDEFDTITLEQAIKILMMKNNY